MRRNLHIKHINLLSNPLLARDYVGTHCETYRPVETSSDKSKSGASKRRSLIERRRAELPQCSVPQYAATPHANPVGERRQEPAALERSHRDLQNIVAQLDTLREEEQRRLAHDMHDDLGQLLAAMKIDLATLRRRLQKSNPELVPQIDSLHELVDTMVISVRRIIADLPPKVLEDFGLFSAVEMLVTSFQKRHQIRTLLDKPASEPELPCNLRTPVYRMLQEALNNIAKHARATVANVAIAWEDRQIFLLITDNGTGLAPCCLQKPDSFGLIGMRQRVVALGGKFSISSVPGSGTAIRIAIPVPPPPTASGN